MPIDLDTSDRNYDHQIIHGDAEINRLLEEDICRAIAGYNPNLSFKIHVLDGGDYGDLRPEYFGQRFMISLGTRPNIIYITVEPRNAVRDVIIDTNHRDEKKKNPIIIRGICISGGYYIEFTYSMAGGLDNIEVSQDPALNGNTATEVHAIIASLSAQSELIEQIPEPTEHDTVHVLESGLSCLLGSDYRTLFRDLLNASPFNRQWVT